MCAWTTKSDRFGAGPAVQTSSGDLGPGAYVGHGKYDESQNFAPFTSTQERGGSTGAKAASRAPPPGTYDPSLPGAYESGLPKKFVAFKSSAVRFGGGAGPDKEKKPGPGAYRTTPESAGPMAHRTMGVPSTEKKPVLRSFSAPSIPQAHQSYGYEEAPGGRLQRQGPTDGIVGHSGRIGDSVGPGQYGQYEDPKRKAPGGKFGHSSRDGKFNELTPGPGHYIEKRLNRPPKLGSSFASKVERIDEVTKLRMKQDVPGAGQYNASVQSKPSLRETHAEMQFFGSTVERFKKSMAGNVDKTPGPGSYMARPKREKSSATPFNHIADRYDTRPTHNFQKQGGFQQTGPGPGAYQAGTCFGNGVDPESAECAKTFSVLGNSGGLAFGAMTKRFIRADVKPDTVPGPGQYDYDEAVDQAKGDGRPKSAGSKHRGKKVGIPGFQFKSKTPKDGTLQQEIKVADGKPPPGAYDPKPIQEAGAIVRVPGKKEGFLSAAGRFSHSKYGVRVPGPGMYDPPDDKHKSFNRSLSQGVPVRGRSTNLGFTSQADRFGDKPITESHHKTPGPGTYETQPEWVSRTYNCLFGEVL